MRVLVTCSGAASHFSPLVPFIDTLLRRGDEALVIVPPALAATVAPTGYPYRLGADPPAAEEAAIWERFSSVSPAEAAVLANKEVFGRLRTAAMLPALEAACDDWRPDLVLREPCEYAGAIAAERGGIPHAQVAISAARIEASCVSLVAPVLEPYVSRMAERISAAPYLTRFPASLDPSPFAVTRRFRHPAGVASATPEPLGDWWDDEAGPLVYATFGTVAGGLPIAAAAYRVALEAVGGLPVRVVLTTGRELDSALLGPIPTNVHVATWVPQHDVLEHAAVVVCHGGSGTTFGALEAGVPLVIVPMFADQPVNARLVAEAGAGIVVAPADSGPIDAVARFLPESVPRLRAAIETVLADTSYRSAATRIAEEMSALPSVEDVLATFGT